MAHAYDTKFMQYAANSSSDAAAIVTGNLQKNLQLTSVLDVGCAHGTWLKSWANAGVASIHGIDGSYVDTTALVIPPDCFTNTDLDKGFDLGRQFDLVQSLEVGEHINRQSADLFAGDIASHAKKFVMFSAAPPGQGGEFHVNEQPFEFWRKKFADQGFAVFDCIRPMIADNRSVSFWYRYNTFFYARRNFVIDLPSTIRRTEVPVGSALRDISPAIFKMRKFVVRSLPYSLQHNMARFKARYFPSGRF